ncbi:hypothetical protein AJ80_01995 [Polytolypa hystricis UAMH7299]|uniref:O-methyltransferase domain-containing protein n=1 Tax=Polytolypa hystricis (strain UAMH7299) TaxID=1447883 RepID=A0A2B7YSG5_POLH7|nr:hypothetical protein AJ80_01995 [Polytolypa hystricis UAMH7299]
MYFQRLRRQPLPIRDAPILCKNQHTNPTNAVDGPFQHALITTWVGTGTRGLGGWMDTGFYPVDDLLVQGARTDIDEVFLDDVGGGPGHDIDEFYRKHPSTPGRLILQDLPVVVGQIEELTKDIERMGA